MRELNKIKKAQEEIVGFALIIVLIAIISLVFLGLQLRQKTPESESRQVENLLNAMLKQTTDCVVYSPQYESFLDLIKSCYYSESCSSGISACQALHETAEKMLDAALPVVQSESPVNSYNMNISYSVSQPVFGRRQYDDLLLLSKGRCSGRVIGYKEFLPLDFGNIEISLKLCY